MNRTIVKLVGGSIAVFSGDGVGYQIESYTGNLLITLDNGESTAVTFSSSSWVSIDVLGEAVIFNEGGS